MKDRIVCRENLGFMAELPDGCCDLIYADPPFFTGKVQRRSSAVLRFRDCWPGGLESYLDFLRPRLAEMRRLLKPSGSLYAHLDWHAVHYVKVLLDQIFGPACFLNEVIWSYRTGGNCTRWFARKHDTLLVYARRAGAHTFHVLRDGRFRTDGMKHDGQGRPYKQTKAGRLYFHPEGPALTDVWEIPFLSTVSLERCGYPTQKPLALLERIIQASSNRGDLVADFFCGSGTTAVAARRLHRHWLGCDISAEAVKLAHHRVQQAAGA